MRLDGEGPVGSASSPAPGADVAKAGSGNGSIVQRQGKPIGAHISKQFEEMVAAERQPAGLPQRRLGGAPPGILALLSDLIGFVVFLRTAGCVGVTLLVLRAATALFTILVILAFATHNLKGQTIVRSFVVVCSDDANAAVHL